MPEQKTSPPVFSSARAPTAPERIRPAAAPAMMKPTFLFMWLSFLSCEGSLAPFGVPPLCLRCHATRAVSGRRRERGDDRFCRGEPRSAGRDHVHHTEEEVFP